MLEFFHMLGKFSRMFLKGNILQTPLVSERAIFLPGSGRDLILEKIWNHRSSFGFCCDEMQCGAFCYALPPEVLKEVPVTNAQK